MRASLLPTLARRLGFAALAPAPALAQAPSWPARPEPAAALARPMAVKLFATDHWRLRIGDESATFLTLSRRF